MMKMLTLGLLFLSSIAWAQTYPSKPIRIIDGFPPGGATTFISRVYGEHLAERLGQPVVVDNRPGVGSNLGASIAAKANPDGHSLLIALTSSLAPAPNLYAHLDYHLLNDFSYVGLIGSGAFVLVVHPSLPVNSLSQLMAYAKSRSDPLRYGSAGIGTPLHLAMELMRGAAHLNLTHVPYKGAAPVVVALTGGEIQMGFSSVAAAVPMVKSMRLRAIAVSSVKRAKVFPDIPTMEEAGLTPFNVTGRYGLLAPLHTPAPIVRLLNQHLVAISHLPEVDAKLQTVGLETANSTPEGFKHLMQEEMIQWAKVIKDAKITAID